MGIPLHSITYRTSTAIKRLPGDDAGDNRVAEKMLLGALPGGDCSLASLHTANKAALFLARKPGLI